MTPFDPAALLAMLLAFYPDVSAESFARARRERPEYFAGGTIGGSHGDKLTLPDGSGWDLIYDVENATGRRHWQVIPAGGDSGAGDPLFALEPGPLTPIDGAAWPTPAPVDVFVPLVADALSELGASETVLAGAASTIAEASSPAVFDATVSGELEDADRARGDELAALDAAVPDDVLAATTGSSGAMDGGEADAEFDAPPYTVPDWPGPPPSDDTPQPGDGYTDPNTGEDKRR